MVYGSLVGGLADYRVLNCSMQGHFMQTLKKIKKFRTVVKLSKTPPAFIKRRNLLNPNEF